MIAYLKGQLSHKEHSLVWVETAGVGYEVRISLYTFQQLGQIEQPVRLYTHLQIREDAHTLFGFGSQSEKQVFLLLTSVSGVGANTALIMLSSLSPLELQALIAREDVISLQRLKGIGTKTAQRIVLELADKMKKLDLSDNGINGTDNSNLTNPSFAPAFAVINNNNFEEALSALCVMGLSKPVAEKALQAVLKRMGSDLSTEEFIRQALKN